VHSCDSCQVKLVKTKQFVSFQWHQQNHTAIGTKKTEFEHTTIKLQINSDIYNDIQTSYQYQSTSNFTQNTNPTFQSKNSGIGIHKSRIGSNRPPQRLIWHAHINNNNTILWRCFTNTYILVRFHSHMSESDEL
jgi:hypothetical protein